MTKNPFKRLLAASLAAALMICASPPARASQLRVLESGTAQIPKLSREGIVTLLEGSAASTVSDPYKTAPLLTKPYSRPGELKGGVLTSALTRLNAIRTLAGVPAVTLSGDYTALAQAGAYVNAALGDQVSHTPARPEGMVSSVYQQGYRGASVSSLAYGFASLGEAVDAWTEDSDEGNLGRLGHRRWQLSPMMSQTGFGQAGGFMAEYVVSRDAQEADYSFISWPASGYFPTGQGFFTPGSAWSVTLNPDLYQTPDRDQITVTLTRLEDEYIWSFTGESSDGFFGVDTSGYGVSNCVIFRPQDVEEYSGVWTVELTGLKTPEGDPADFMYSVEFFDPDQVAAPAGPSYSDVAEGDWFAPAAAYVYDNQVFRDWDAGLFRPNDSLTRAEAAYALWASAGFPKASHAAGFTDLTEDWYVTAVAWACENGVFRGTGGARFQPDTALSRAMLMQVLYNYERAFYSDAEERADLTGFADGESIFVSSAWAVPAMEWAVGRGLVNGMGDNTLSPLSPATRAQLANILMKYE